MDCLVAATVPRVMQWSCLDRKRRAFSWERRAPARLPQPRWSVALPGMAKQHRKLHSPGRCLIALVPASILDYSMHYRLASRCGLREMQREKETVYAIT
jgi:hypothetical protein